MTQPHTSHDWSPISWTCTECGTGFNSIDAGLKCQPSTDDRKPDPDPQPAVIDYSAITRGFCT